MCQNCTWDMIAGRPSSAGNFVCPEFLDDCQVPTEKFKLNYLTGIRNGWKEYESSIPGTKVFMQQFKAKSIRAVCKFLSKERKLSKQGAEIIELIEAIQLRKKLPIYDLCSIRNPFNPAIPHFRMIYATKDYLLVGNNINNPRYGIIKIYGSRKTLIDIGMKLYSMLEKYATGHSPKSKTAELGSDEDILQYAAKNCLLKLNAESFSVKMDESWRECSGKGKKLFKKALLAAIDNANMKIKV